jgi:hypothetical protein
MAASGQDPPAGPGRGGTGEPVVVDVSGLVADTGGHAPDGPGVPGRRPSAYVPGPDALAAVAALARLRLAARRTGHRVRLRGASPRLRRLLELAGLAGEFEWEAEEGEEPGGVEE